MITRSMARQNGRNKQSVLNCLLHSIVELNDNEQIETQKPEEETNKESKWEEELERISESGRHTLAEFSESDEFIRYQECSFETKINLELENIDLRKPHKETNELGIHLKELLKDVHFPN